MPTAKGWEHLQPTGAFTLPTGKPGIREEGVIMPTKPVKKKPEPDWEALEKEAALLSPKGYHGERSRLDPDKIIAQAQHLAELYRQYGKPIPDGLAVLI